MIEIFLVPLPPFGDGIEPLGTSYKLPAVPSAGDVFVSWVPGPKRTEVPRRFKVDHVKWWNGENRADLVGTWVEE